VAAPNEARQLIRETQTSAGGWTSAEGRTVLHATYYVARAVHAMAIPRRDALASFISRCRRADGSYSAAPDDAQGDLVNSYFALTIDRWTNDPDGHGAN
jgi:prenyltransferase beta subunit